MNSLDIEKSNNENKMENKKTMLNITYEDLLFIASGKTEDDMPSSVVTIVIDKLNLNDEQVTDMQVILQSSVSTFFASGGCLVVQVDFPKTNAFEYRRAIDIISTYMQNSANPEYVDTHAFGVVVVPMVLEGLVSFVLQDLVYFTGFDMPDNNKRLIMCFNDLETDVIESGDEIDYLAIENQVRMQLQREYDQREMEIEAMQQELREIEAQNPYEQMVQEQLQKSANIVHKDDGTKVTDNSNQYVRFSKD